MPRAQRTPLPRSLTNSLTLQAPGARAMREFAACLPARRLSAQRGGGARPSGPSPTRGRPLSLDASEARLCGCPSLSAGVCVWMGERAGGRAGGCGWAVGALLRPRRVLPEPRRQRQGGHRPRPVEAKEAWAETDIPHTAPTSPIPASLPPSIHPSIPSPFPYSPSKLFSVPPALPSSRIPPSLSHPSLPLPSPSKDAANHPTPHLASCPLPCRISPRSRPTCGTSRSTIRTGPFLRQPLAPVLGDAVTRTREAVESLRPRHRAQPGNPPLTHALPTPHPSPTPRLGHALGPNRATRFSPT